MTGEQKPGGLEVVAWRFRFIGPKGRVWSVQKNKPAWYRDDQDTILEPLTPAEPAEARIRSLEAKLARAKEALEQIMLQSCLGIRMETITSIADQTLAALQQEGE